MGTEQLLELVKRKGPVIPSDVAKAIGQNLLFTSAMLSELSSRGAVKISHLKIGGGSPLYYTPEQAPQLTKFIANLDEKDQRAVRELEQAKVLRESDLSPLIRVGLRESKDFAVPLQVQRGEESEIFWKWYLVDDADAEDRIRDILTPKQNDQAEVRPAPEEPPREVPTSKQAERPSREPAPSSDEPESGPRREDSKEKTVEPDPPSKQGKPQEKKRSDRQEQLDKKADAPNKREKASSKAATDEDKSEFQQEVETYFDKAGVTVKKSKVVRKSREYEYIVEVPSAVGLVSFVCIAKNKKSLSDGDLASLFLTAQKQKLPLLVLSDAKLTKKAQAMMEDELRGLTIARLDDKG